MGWLTLEEDHPLEKQLIVFMYLGKVIHYIKMPLSGEGNYFLNVESVIYVSENMLEKLYE